MIVEAHPCLTLRPLQLIHDHSFAALGVLAASILHQPPVCSHHIFHFVGPQGSSGKTGSSTVCPTSPSSPLSFTAAFLSVIVYKRRDALFLRMVVEQVLGRRSRRRARTLLILQSVPNQHPCGVFKVVLVSRARLHNLHRQIAQTQTLCSGYIYHVSYHRDRVQSQHLVQRAAQ